MRYRVVDLANNHVRLIEADTPLGAAERTVQHPIRGVEVWHHEFEGSRATTWILHDGWVTVIHPDREAVTS